MLNLYFDMCAAFSVVLILDAFFTRWQQKRYKRKVPMNKWRNEDYPDMSLVYDGGNGFIMLMWLLFAWPAILTVLFLKALLNAIKAFFESLRGSINDIFSG